MLHYEESGTGEPVVFLHGGGPGASGRSNFGTNFPVFAERFRAILVDQPCFGQSAAVSQVEGHYWTYAADKLAELLDHLGIEKAHLVGNSLGGGTAIRFALRHPARVDKLVLMGPGGLSINVFSPDPTEGTKRLFEFSAPPGPSREKLSVFLKTLVYDQNLVTEELLDERFASASSIDTLKAIGAMGRSFMDPATRDQGLLWREAHQIKHETLLIWGREDRVNPLDGALVALKTMKNAQLHVFGRCGHWAQLEQFDQFNQLAMNFLEGNKA